jgi:alpha-beta hydrolase superfamily lysophospholipase
MRTLSMRDGAELAWRHWEVRTPRGVVVAVHGIRSHSGWYTGSCGQLASAGYEVVFPDRRGAGLNKAFRGDVSDWRVLVDDLAEFVGSVRRRLGGVPVHLEAISWGARLACAGCILHPDLADSLVLVTPGLAAKADMSFAAKLGTAAACLVNPRKLFDVPLADARLFTANPDRIAWIERDELSLGRCTARFLRETRKLERFVRRNAERLRTPLLMMLAGRDRIVDNDRVRRLFDRFGSRPKEVTVHPDAEHTLEFEEKPMAIYEEMARWLDERSRKSG